MDRPIDYGEFDRGRGKSYWDLDRTLRREVARTYDPDDLEAGRSVLSDFGETVATTVADNADVVDDHGPELHTYDDCGEIANRVEYHPAHVENERVVYGSGIVADAFESREGRDRPLGFLHNLSMGYLLGYADTGLYCPVAMTAGVALVAEKFDAISAADLSGYLDGLTARDRPDLIEGAMFLTEKAGGSDLGNAVETTARKGNGEWRLYGEKWFCSNLDAGAKLVLARREGAPDGMDGLSLFLVPHEAPEEGGDDAGAVANRQRKAAGAAPNDMLCRRLKDKLGTVSVPTGEVELRGARAHLIGDTERGFKYMSEMVNLERLSNAVGACGVVGRALLESKVHAANREAFGGPLAEKPLMRADLAEMAVDHEAATAFTFDAARAFHRRERAIREADRPYPDLDGEPDREAYRLLRALVPVAKYRTGRLAVDATSYAMEIRGGDGYVNDYVHHRLLRDAQVLPIWEGASNVLALDLLRALDREDAHEPLLGRIESYLGRVEGGYLAGLADRVREEYADLGTALATLATEDRDYAQLTAKDLADFVFDVYAAALLCAQAQDRIDEDGDARLALVARAFADRHLEDGRGIADGDRFADRYFDELVRYAPIAPEDLPDEPFRE